ncbi:hypothetical protein Zmor_001596 [Zophobas morio]|uniref:Reverse transcriptase domain-containing protein n=1 Tax=Zophobas morio TaxID=2755281 RepID=A0AA38MSS3_9CUCU|nr:hypothetical protein Zmor_001596 [Zophobas morio]
MKLNEYEYSNPQSIVNAFATHFKDVYIMPDPSVSNDIYSSDEFKLNFCINIESISEEEVFKALKSSKNSFTQGFDEIPSFILKDCAGVFSQPLCTLFNLILKHSTIPEIWKKSFTTPIFKKGDVQDVKNYRPITLICNFGKIFDTILCQRIYPMIKDIISSEQHGFMRKRSTVTNLACFNQFVAEVMDSGSQVDTVYLDFQKAFDQVDHHILLTKLKIYGFSDSLVSLFTSYLLNRKQYVRYRNFISDFYTPTSGIPQGSNLGPLLFLLFMNDITAEISCNKLLFADDLKLFTEIKSINDCQFLKNNLQSVMKWCGRNRLHLNKDKCSMVSYSRKKRIFEYDYIIQ